MKRLSLLFIVIFLFSCQQEKKEGLKEHYLKTYEKAKELNSAIDEANALLHLVVIDKENSQKWEDSLFYAYSRMGNNTAVMALGEKLLQKRPEDTLLLGVLTEVYQMYGDYEKAFQTQLKLYNITKLPQDEYRLAILEFNMGKTDAALKRVNALLERKDLDNVQVVVTMQNGSTQQVPIKAALHNARGIVYLMQQKPTEAQKEFLKALEIAPDFVLPKNNLQAFFGRR